MFQGPALRATPEALIPIDRLRWAMLALVGQIVELSAFDDKYALLTYGLNIARVGQFTKGVEE